jgi:lipopolysaccharide export system protein LptA
VTSWLRFALAGPRSKRASLCAAMAAIVMLTAVGALAQKGQVSQGVPNALQGFSQNRDQPVKIQADRLEVRDKDKVATFTGNVHVTQGDTEMRSRALVVYYEDSAKGAVGNAPAAGKSEQQQIRRIEATGGVRVIQREQNAVGDTGIFDVQSNTVTLTGNVVVIRGKDVVRGQRLVVDLNTGVSHMESAAGGQVETLIGPHNESNPVPARPQHAN